MGQHCRRNNLPTVSLALSTISYLYQSCTGHWTHYFLYPIFQVGQVLPSLRRGVIGFPVFRHKKWYAFSGFPQLFIQFSSFFSCLSFSGYPQLWKLVFHLPSLINFLPIFPIFRDLKVLFSCFCRNIFSSFPQIFCGFSTKSITLWGLEFTGVCRLQGGNVFLLWRFHSWVDFL